MKVVAQKMSPLCTLEFWNTNSRHTVNFEATDFPFWLKVNWIWAFKCCFICTIALLSISLPLSFVFLFTQKPPIFNLKWIKKYFLQGKCLFFLLGFLAQQLLRWALTHLGSNPSLQSGLTSRFFPFIHYNIKLHSEILFGHLWLFLVSM